MKVKALIASCLLGAAGYANALPPTTTPQVSVFIAGSSALNADLVAEITGSICTAGTIDVYLDANSTGGGGDQSAIFCTGQATLSANLANKAILTYYRKNGGSIFGVYPVGTTAIHRYDIAGATAACPTAPGTAGGKCTGWAGAANQVTDTPILGISDVEPGMFVGLNLPAPSVCAVAPFSDSCPQAGTNFTSQSVLVQAFGVVVNNALRDALDAAQGAAAGTTANMASAWVVDAFGTASTVYNASDWTPLGSVVAAAGGGTAFTGAVQICRRAAGSGTQAEMNAHFFNTPCSSAFQVPAAVADSGPGYTVTENASSGAVKTCLNNAQTAGVKAIGILSYDQQPVAGTDNWSFVTLDGQAISDANVTNGKYEHWVESTMQTAKGLAGGQLDYATLLASSLRTVTTTSPNGVYNLSVAAAGPKTMKGTRGGNTCRPPLF